MNVFLLILATHGGSNITLRPIDNFKTLQACTDAGRAQVTIAASKGEFASVGCFRVKM